MEFADELECLVASYSSQELEIISSGGNEALLKFMIQPGSSSSPQRPTINIIFKIPPSYPLVTPEISISFNPFTNAERMQIEKEIQTYASTIIGLPMIMDLVTWIKEKVNGVLAAKEDAVNAENVNAVHGESFLNVLLIDHMRSKSSYVKTLKAWAPELNVNGVLMFCQKRIFLILQGTKHNVKAFVMRLKTTCIDVDSAGRKCKEKMSKIIFEGCVSECFHTFSVEEFVNFVDLEQYLQKKNLSEIFNFKDYFMQK